MSRGHIDDEFVKDEDEEDVLEVDADNLDIEDESDGGF